MRQPPTETEGDKRIPIGYMICMPIPNTTAIGIGISICHRLDRFNKRIGRDFAMQRINRYDIPIYIKEREDNFYDSIEDQISYFAQRCNRFYSEQQLILPKVLKHKYPSKTSV
jgi:hypothetical protein